ncbi:MAG TPA: ABC transporter permease [Vicinamibacterales bacterium]|nr:ABC transporter permease [Vicinamibacterales bacterium]
MTDRSSAAPQRERPPHPLVELTLSRFRDFVREPEAVFWVFAFPIIMTCALGIAFRSRGEEPVIAGVVDHAGADQVADALTRGGFTVRRIPLADVESALRDGRAPVVVIPGSPPVYRYDEARAESQLARLAVDNALQRAAGRADAFTPVRQPIEAVGSRYIDWLVPGLLGMNIMGTGMWGVGFAIVQARAKKLLKRLIATPMSKTHFLLSLVLSRLATLSLEVIIIIGFGWLAFDVAVRGPIWVLAALSLCGALAFGGIGLLVASRARTIEAVSGLMNLFMLPMWVLSGVFFASTNFPDVMQPFIRILPLTALNDALRLVINEGRTFTAVLPQLAILLGWGSISFLVSLKLFRWQ